MQQGECPRPGPISPRALQLIPVFRVDSSARLGSAPLGSARLGAARLAGDEGRQVPGYWPGCCGWRDCLGGNDQRHVDSACSDWCGLLTLPLPLPSSLTSRYVSRQTDHQARVMSLHRPTARPPGPKPGCESFELSAQFQHPVRI